MCRYKIGEKVKVLPGFTNSFMSSKDAGYGYLETDLQLTIREVDKSKYPDDKDVYFFQEIPNGIYEFALISVVEIREQTIDKVLYG